MLLFDRYLSLSSVAALSRFDITYRSYKYSLKLVSSVLLILGSSTQDGCRLLLFQLAAMRAGFVQSAALCIHRGRAEMPKQQIKVATALQPPIHSNP